VGDALGRWRAAGGNRDPVQVVGQHDLAAEGLGCLVGEVLAVTVLVALGEVGEDQQPVMPKAASLSGSIRRPPGSTSR
jgi:hypothetical protein